VINVRNVVVYATRSSKAVKAALLTASLFPGAVYHIVSTVPTLRSRTSYTRMFQEVVESIVDDSIKDVELALLSRGIEVLRKKVLRGDLVRSVVDYVLRTKADFIVTGSSSASFIANIILKIVKSVNIQETRVPLLVHTPKARDVGAVSEVALITHSAGPEDLPTLLAIEVSKKFRAVLRVIPLTEMKWLSRSALSEGLGAGEANLIIENVPAGGSVADEVLKMTKYSDFIILEEVRGTGLTQVLEKRVLCESTAPVVIT